DAATTLEAVVEHDLLGRITFRRWSDGSVEAFERDSSGRLTRWTRTGNAPDERIYHYEGDQLVAEDRNGSTWRRLLDEAGRVLALTGPVGETVTYRYDACGRRTERIAGEQATRYAYDALGQLTSIDDSRHGLIEQTFDGLGRRVRRGDVREHRDHLGRLWSET